MKRYLFNQVLSDLQKKMVFIGGPRQVGKTHLAKKILRASGKSGAYLNWDDDDDRVTILSRQFPKSDLLVLDEIHKNRKWRGLVKGLFDKYHPSLKIVVTGSARLDYYRFGGDSLQGRYHYFRLHPLTARELGISTQRDLETLFRLGGFPEPFFSGSDSAARRWRKTYRQRFIREDLVALEKTEDLASLELLALRLPDLVGSPLSINSLREDLNIHHETARKWCAILERLYHIFRLSPFGSPKIKAVKKESKHYHFHGSLVQDEGARFENFIASHLLKWCHWIEDVEGYDMELRYFRDREQREVDFVVMKEGKPILFCEAKMGDRAVSKHLRYLKAKFPEARAIQVVYPFIPAKMNADGLELLPALDFLRELPV